ncbi:endonuclease/exonuclease/phosphatase family protein [Calycomorphotria hydatis]|uniref:Endonuclease/Exonuclease/phosphatase family protein n=1 Tax=Calycomorphotria hydatis TaxID=2528027 RepID=A0A517T4R3_9PLAN|nr:endonuclease/exonuclease/phosphatase family protein [Calycomorphotria hydatis]QDT63373.1 Endonuclease/Exonuclease/phosphatase family protein [Calycomorphotria hydatis]
MSSESIAWTRRITCISCSLLLLSVGLFSLGGCDSEKWLPEVSEVAGDLVESVGTTIEPVSHVITGGEKIKIASFNIQVFGQTKASKPKVMKTLASIIREFDVVAVQEIRTKDPEPVKELLAEINHGGYHYDVLLGPRLGRTSSKEQYAYIYNASRIEVARNSIYTVNDRRDWLHREPYVARFRVITDDPNSGFTFTLVNIHTDPDEVEFEIDVLDDVLRSVARSGRSEDDIILLGDLNAAPDEFGELGKLPSLQWVVKDEPTNTRRSKTYDNILFSSITTTEYTGRGGVYDFPTIYSLSKQDALAVSDHLPVWAEFTAKEAAPARIAGEPRSRN